MGYYETCLSNSLLIQKLNTYISYFTDFSQYPLNNNGFSCQSVKSAMLKMPGIRAADVHNSYLMQNSHMHMLQAILLQESDFIRPTLLI